MNFPPLAAVVAALVCLAASADRPEYAWGKTFEVEELADMVLDGDGNLYVALNEFIDLTPEQNGVTYHDNRIGRLHKYAPDGTLLWDKVIAGPRAVIGEIRFGLDGYLYIAGRMQGDCVFKPGEEAAPMSALLDEYVDAFGTRYTAPGLDDFLLRLSGEGDLNGAMLFGDPWFTPRSFEETEQLPESLIPSGGTRHFRFAALTDGFVHIYRTRQVFQEVLTIQRLGRSPTLHNGYGDGRLIRVHFDTVDVQHRAFYDYSSSSSGGMVVDPDGNLLLFGGFSRGHDFDPGPGEHRRVYPLTLPFSDGAMGAFWTLTPELDFVRAGTYSTAGSPDSVSHYGYDGLSRGYAIGGTFLDGMTLDWTDENLVTVDLTDVYLGVQDAGHALLRFDADGEHIDTRTLPEVYREPGGVTYRYDLAKNAGRAPVNAAGALYLSYSLLHTVADPALEPPARSVLLTCDAPDDGCDTALIKFDDALEPEWHAVFTATREKDTDEISRLNHVLPAPSGAVYYASSYGGASIDLDPTDGVDTAVVPPNGRLYFITKLNDIAEPDVRSIVRAGTNPTKGPLVAFTVTYDEPVTGVDIDDFALTATGAVTGASIVSVSGADAVWTVTVDVGTGEGTLRLDALDDDLIKSATDEPLGGPGLGNGAYTEGEAYTLDYTGPVAVITNIGPDYTIIPQTQVVVTFDEPVTGLDAADFLVTNGVVTDVTGSGPNYIVTIEITAPGDATIELIGGGVGDIAGNANGASAPLTVQFIDLNGDPSIPAAAWWALGITAAALAALGSRYRDNKPVP